MNIKGIRFIIFSALAIIFAGTAQGSHLFALQGIRPNLILVFLIIFSFFIDDLWHFALLVIFGAIGIHFSPGLSIEAIALALIAMSVFFIKQRAVWPGVWGSAILVFLGTFAMYLLVHFSYLYQQFGIIFFESLYNIVIGIILFEFIAFMTRQGRRL